MKTAEEVAKDFLEFWDEDPIPNMAVAELLNAFRDRAVEKALIEGLKDFRNEALEEAAKICDKRKEGRYSSDCAVEAGYMAEEIRSLKK